MSEALLVRRGGGVGKLFAAIGVTYPAGSTCTCTKGSKTLKAKDTIGRWVFPVPEAGTWTVTATDGSNTKSETVEITAQGQIKDVTLTFSLILYDKGNEYSAVTGGWIEYGDRYNQSGEANYKPKQTSEIQFAQGGGGYYVKTNNSIDLSGCSTLYAHVISMHTAPAAQYAPSLKITSGAGGNDGTIKAQLTMYASNSGQATVSDRTFELAIGSATNGYVAVSLSDSSQGYVRIDKIWAE